MQNVQSLHWDKSMCHHYNDHEVEKIYCVCSMEDGYIERDLGGWQDDHNSVQVIRSDSKSPARNNDF